MTGKCRIPILQSFINTAKIQRFEHFNPFSYRFILVTFLAAKRTKKTLRLGLFFPLEAFLLIWEWGGQRNLCCLVPLKNDWDLPITSELSHFLKRACNCSPKPKIPQVSAIRIAILQRFCHQIISSIFSIKIRWLRTISVNSPDNSKNLIPLWPLICINNKM